MKDTTLNAFMVLATIAIAVATFGLWLRPGGLHPSGKATVSEQSTPSPTTNVPSSQEKPPIRAEKQSPPESLTRRSAPTIPHTEPPWEFGLEDGEQKVILSGRVTLSIQFNNVAGEEFPTLRLSVGDESTPHALLGAGERFKFSSKGRPYYVSVLSIDQSSKTVRIRVDAVR